MNGAPPQIDVGAIVGSVGIDWLQLKKARLLITGGTGFIGRWMLAALIAADLRYDLNMQVVLITRDPRRFAAAAPDLFAHPAVTAVAGDVSTGFTADGSFDFVIHAATDASADLTNNDPRRMFDTIVDGTRRTLDFAQDRGARRTLFLSSGAVYGAQPWDVSHVPEDWIGAPDCTEPKNTYAEGKRAAEMLCAIARKQAGLDVVTARIFAVLGPMLSLDSHFAAGNFIRDAMAKRRIVVQGAGTAVRSYIYAGDLAAWLWLLLLRTTASSTYNLGSEEAVSISELAHRVAHVLNGPGVDVLGAPDPGWNPGRYVPSTARIRDDLAIASSIDLDEAIRRTAIWNGWTA